MQNNSNFTDKSLTTILLERIILKTGGLSIISREIGVNAAVYWKALKNVFDLLVGLALKGLSARR